MSDTPRHPLLDEDLSGLLLTVPAVAEIAGVSRTTLWRMVRDGRLVPDFASDTGECLFHPSRIVERIEHAQSKT